MSRFRGIECLVDEASSEEVADGCEVCANSVEGVGDGSDDQRFSIRRESVLFIVFRVSWFCWEAVSEHKLRAQLV
jgi:hypothetical protein